MEVEEVEEMVVEVAGTSSMCAALLRRNACTLAMSPRPSIHPAVCACPPRSRQRRST